MNPASILGLQVALYEQVVTLTAENEQLRAALAASQPDQ